MSVLYRQSKFYFEELITDHSQIQLEIPSLYFSEKIGGRLIVDWYCWMVRWKLDSTFFDSLWSMQIETSLVNLLVSLAEWLHEHLYCVLIWLPFARSKDTSQVTGKGQDVPGMVAMM